MKTVLEKKICPQLVSCSGLPNLREGGIKGCISITYMSLVPNVTKYGHWFGSI